VQRVWGARARKSRLRVAESLTRPSPLGVAPPLSPSPFPLQGQPLYFKTFVGGSEESLKLQLAAYAAMDIVEEKLSDRKALVARLAQETAAGGAGGAAGGAAAAAAAGAKDSFLGMLMPVDEYKM
jgi:hypothetical protein